MKNRKIHNKMTKNTFALALLLICTNIWGQITIKKGGEQVQGTTIHYCAGDTFEASVQSNALSFNDYTGIPTERISISSGNTNIPFRNTNPNVFSNPIDIGFNFTFYGKTYAKVSVGRNGRIVFTNQDLSDDNTYIDRIFSGVREGTKFELPSTNYNKIYKNEPSREFPMAQIFAGYTDIDFNSNRVRRTIYRYSQNYNYNGTEGFLISMQNLIQTNGVGGFSNNEYNSYILLLKDGRIIIKVDNKTDDRYNAILGIQNEDATKFWAENNYNNGNWKSDGNSVVFTPSPKRVSSIKWYVNNVEKHTGQNYHYTPTADTETLKAIITFDDNTTEESEIIIFKKLQKPTFTATKVDNTCLAGYMLKVDNPISGVQYSWYRDSVFLGQGAEITANQSGEYYVIPNNCQNSKSDTKTITIQGDVPSISITENHTFSECGMENNYTFNLLEKVNYPANPAQYTIKFYEENGTEITNPTAYSLNSGQKRKLKIEVKSNTSTCSDSRWFSIEYQELPKNGLVLTVPKKLCTDDTLYTLEDFKIDFPEYAHLDIKFSKDNTNFGLETINPKESNYVKISKSGANCEYKGKLDFQFHNEIVVKPYTQFPEHCVSRSEFFDLNITKNQLEYDDITARFYEKYENGVFSDEITNLQYRGGGTIYIQLENSNGCVYQGNPPVLNLIVYRKPTLAKSTEHKKSVCGSRVFDLTTNIRDYIGNWSRYAEIRYYDANHNRLSQSEWENYNPDVSGQPYMVFVYNETNNLECSDTIRFDLEYLTKPQITQNTINICEETSYPLSQFKQRVIANPNDYQFFAEDGITELTNDISWNTLPYSFKFFIKNKATGCISDLQTVEFKAGNLTNLQRTSVEYALCDADFDGITIFDLNSVNFGFTNDTSAKIEYFSDRERRNPISSNYQNVGREEIIYVKITSPNFCPSYSEINLKVKTPTKSSTLVEKYYICYGETVAIDAGNENTTFQWSDGQTTQTATFNKVGKYSITLYNSDGCPYTHHFEISDEKQPIIEKINANETKIEVIATGGIAPYQYSFDGGATWQISNILNNPSRDSYTISVKSADGCLGEPKSIYNVKVYNVITPNDDGKNDTWNPENLDQMEQVEITIVDRYGKPVFQSNDKNNIVWNGKINGRPLPTGTYWYVVKWYDTAQAKQEVRQGWILLKNRD